MSFLYSTFRDQGVEEYTYSNVSEESVREEDHEPSLPLDNLVPNELDEDTYDDLAK